LCRSGSLGAVCERSERAQPCNQMAGSAATGLGGSALCQPQIPEATLSWFAKALTVDAAIH
jgi:hypothetical protein